MNKSVGGAISLAIEGSITKHVKKDILKFLICNKLISRGVGSSGLYAEICSEICNTGEYIPRDIVGVSVNGDRQLRESFDPIEVDKAIEAKVTFITDVRSNRERSYNLGEREVAKYLENNGYRESGSSGRWNKT